MILSVGQRVRFAGEKRAYRVRAANERFAICTKPFNPRRTVLYTIIDFRDCVRGTENLIFCLGFETDEQCQEALVRLTTGETQVSSRNQVRLNIEKVL